jgi:hypothetical protein|nr:MAG TPA: hypothetical protein [Caudoviricetes sp.]
MSNFDDFFQEYDHLRFEYGSTESFLVSLGVENPLTLSGRLNAYKRNGLIPPPSVLQLFELVIDPVLITNCMADYLNENETQNCGKFDNMAMEYIDKYRKAETQTVKETRKARKEAYRNLVKERCLLLGV